MNSTEFLIGLDFLGAGNLGDDLMVAGFLTGIRSLGLNGRMRNLKALCSWDRSSQKRRFPEIEWVDGGDSSIRAASLGHADVLLGVGGTPFQMTVGDWLLRNIEEVIAKKRPNAPFVLVNVGGETEAGREVGRFKSAMENLASISTRDAHTFDLLTHWRAGQAEPAIVSGADLANIALPDLCHDHPKRSDRPHELAVILGADTLNSRDIEVVIRWIIANNRPVAWITCEVRDMPGGEYRIYRRNRHRFAWFLTKKWRPKVHLLRPEYSTCTTKELVDPFAQCQTVLSSRYHGILAAAWSGCRVGGIARSSKVKWLCSQLGVPTIEPPLTHNAMARLREEACTVDQEVLSALHSLALKSLKSLDLGDY
jgi:polysaccharide pyruvyl transferase WcaK-like protein